MKLHWSPSRLPDWVLVVVALLSIGGFYLFEHTKRRVKVKDYELKLAATQTTYRAFDEVRNLRDELNWPIDTLYDPLVTGLIGHQYSPITTRRGELTEKILTTNPNFAAIVVELFQKAGIKEGDVVGIGWNGSYPGLNIAVLAACEVMHVKPVAITSNESSMWGANDSMLTWLHIEKRLVEKKIFGKTTLWATIGGDDDNGLGVTQHGVDLIIRSIQDNGFELRRFQYFDDDVRSRIDSYGDIKAYINIGYNPASYGPAGVRIEPGVIRHPRWKGEVKSVLQYYMAQGKPVINLVSIDEIVSDYIEPQKFMEGTAPGNNRIFNEMKYSLTITGLVVLVIGIILFGLIRFDLFSYLIRRGK